MTVPGRRLQEPTSSMLSTLLSTLQGAALLAVRTPPVRCSLASSGEAFLVPDASVPCVIFELRGRSDRHRRQASQQANFYPRLGKRR